MKIVLISCTKSKDKEATKSNPLPANKLYTGTAFKKAYQYARQLTPDRIYILSAKHGLLKPDDKVCYYDDTLKDKPSQERKLWAENVLDQLRKEKLNLNKDEFIILAGQTYCKDLTGPGKIAIYKTPYEGKRIGEILHFLNQELDE